MKKIVDSLGNQINVGDWILRPFVDYRTPKLKYCNVLRVEGTIQTIGYSKSGYCSETWVEDRIAVGNHCTNESIILTRDELPEDVYQLFLKSKYNK